MSNQPTSHHLDGTTLPDETIYEALSRLGLTRAVTRQVISRHTRDVENLTVYRDAISGVIFIDDHYVGNDVYESGAYRQNSESDPDAGRSHPSLEDYCDTERRFGNYKQFIVGKNICDFGCGAGSFLKKSRPLASHVSGVELQSDLLEALRGESIPCMTDISQADQEFDAVFLFHSFEHLSEPAKTLRSIRAKLKAGGVGKIIIEVPHARDFLIDGLSCREFVDFTLWSQHLILHTRESIKAFLYDAGFGSVTVEGAQRFGLANHLHWLSNKTPGGHKSQLSVLETPALKNAYADALSKLDANDTLIAVAST